mgnify:CR=1 FL=1
MEARILARLEREEEKRLKIKLLEQENQAKLLAKQEREEERMAKRMADLNIKKEGEGIRKKKIKNGRRTIK